MVIDLAVVKVNIRRNPLIWNEKDKSGIKVSKMSKIRVIITINILRFQEVSTNNITNDEE